MNTSALGSNVLQFNAYALPSFSNEVTLRVLAELDLPDLNAFTETSHGALKTFTDVERHIGEKILACINEVGSNHPEEIYITITFYECSGKFSHSIAFSYLIHCN